MPTKAPKISAIPQWIITGATRGIGEAFACQLAEPGRHLFLSGRHAKDLLRVQSLCESMGAQVSTHLADLSEQGAVALLLRNSIEAFQGDGPIGLVNNAGFSEHGPVAELHRTTIDALLAVNLRAPLELCHQLIPLMKSRGGGAILNVSSVAGFQGVPGQSVYAASKSCLLSFGIGLHYELLAQGIRVSTLCPGLTKTNFFDNAEIDTSKRFGRLGHWMEPADVARFGLKSLAANRAVAIPHILNKLPIFLQRFASRKFIAKTTHWIMQ